MNKNDNANGKNSFFVFINKILPNSGIIFINFRNYNGTTLW